MEKIRWGIIGAGGIADRRAIPALFENDENEIVAVSASTKESAKRIAEKYGVENYFADTQELFENVKCDAVYIATPVVFHKEQALLALKYGVNVLLEKPIALNFNEADEILTAFKKANKQLCVGYMMGHHSLHKKAKEIISGGGIGNVNLVRMQFSCWYPQIEGAWRQKKSLGGGGCIMDLAVHCMELFSFITGEDIKETKAFFSTRTFDYEVEDGAVIAFKSENGIMGNIDVNFNIPDSASLSRLELYGTSGSITAEGTLGQEDGGMLKYVYAPQSGYEAQQARGMEEAKVMHGEGKNLYTSQFNAFNTLLKNGITDYTSAEHAVKIQKLCDEIYNNA